jgi:hypothetical protein
MSVRPRGPNMWEILDNCRGICNVWIIPKGTPLPNELVLMHERGDHFSVQTTGTMSFIAISLHFQDCISVFGKGICYKNMFSCLFLQLVAFTVACKPRVLNARLTEFMKPLEMISKDEYFKRFSLV